MIFFFDNNKKQTKNTYFDLFMHQREKCINKINKMYNEKKVKQHNMAE